MEAPTTFARRVTVNRNRRAAVKAYHRAIAKGNRGDALWAENAVYATLPSGSDRHDFAAVVG